MTVRIENKFAEYVDLFDVTVEALETAPRSLFEKLMKIVIAKYRKEEIELQRRALELDDMEVVPVDDLDDFYDTILDAVDDVKLFKKKLAKVMDRDALFRDLYDQMDALHTALVQYMDRMGQLEIHEMRANTKLSA